MSHTPILIVEDQPDTPYMSLVTYCLECQMEIARTDVDASQHGRDPETADWAATRGNADGDAWLNHVAEGRA